MIANAGFDNLATQGKYKDKIFEQLQQLEVKNETCNIKLSKIKDYCDKYPQNSKGFKKNILQILGERNIVSKYKGCLDEIEKICNCNDTLQGDFNIVDCDKYQLGKHNLANKILQKIKEVKNNEI